MDRSRVLPLQAVHNFRDYGGYATNAGTRVKPGLLWRSAQHGDATAADLEAIDALGLRHVVDLRGPSEREAKPCLRHPDFSAEVFTYPEETAGLALHTAAANGVATAAEAREAMLRLYEGIAFRENLIPMLRCLFMVLGRGEGASLVHCVAGKDRTGLAVALVQHALGVGRDELMADYLLTNSASNLDRRIDSGEFRMIERYAAYDAETVRHLWGVEEDYLATALRAIEQRHGTIDAYLAEVIQIDGPAIERLRELYWES